MIVHHKVKNKKSKQSYYRYTPTKHIQMKPSSINRNRHPVNEEGEGEFGSDIMPMKNRADQYGHITTPHDNDV